MTLDAQEIGKFHALNIGPDAFNQELLARFLHVGAPVEKGPLGLRLAHGKICKLKTSPRGKGFFSYLFLPDEAYKAVMDYRRGSGIEAWERGGVVN